MDESKTNLVRFESNAPFAIRRIELLRHSYKHWTGRDLLPEVTSPIDAVGALYDAPFAVLSHGTQADPLFNYGNRLALQLFEMTWDEFINMPSRFTTEPARQQDREHLLAQVSAQGYTDNYSGIRLSKTGRRFKIRDATVWNVIDEHDIYHGQAAVIRAWEYV